MRIIKNKLDGDGARLRGFQTDGTEPPLLRNQRTEGSEKRKTAWRVLERLADPESFISHITNLIFISKAMGSC